MTSDFEQKQGLYTRVEEDFSFHPNTGEEVAETHEEVRYILREAAKRLIDVTPVCREQSLMLTALEEAMHWANSGIAKHQYVSL